MCLFLKDLCNRIFLRRKANECGGRSEALQTTSLIYGNVNQYGVGWCHRSPRRNYVTVQGSRILPVIPFSGCWIK